MPTCFFWWAARRPNATVIDMLLASYEGVVAAETGHVACHEAGAIEFGGHKVLTIPGYEGKMHAEDLENYIQVFYENESYEHTVFPGAVYVSLSTEYGTLYSKAELAAIHAVCQKREIPLFVDGARLAYALAADECDITLPELAQLCDVFYIGGTKCGALCGEAVVFCGMHAPAHPIPRIKQHGALLAKGRLTGVQFEALFTDGLYFEIGRQGDRNRAGASSRAARARLPVLLGDAHKPAVCDFAQRGHGAHSRACRDRVLGKVRRDPHRGALLHQLGHDAGGHRRVGGCPVG